MAASINKENLEHLARLARIELTSGEEERLLKDLQNILDYFQELEAVDTTGVEPMNGGTHLTNIFREDEERADTNQGKGVEQFPEKEGGYLKVPPVFEQN